MKATTRNVLIAVGVLVIAASSGAKVRTQTVTSAFSTQRLVVGCCGAPICPGSPKCPVSFAQVIAQLAVKF